MANEQNLKPYSKGQPSSEEAKRRGAAGGRASAAARRERKRLQELANDILQRDVLHKQTGEMITTGEAMLLKQVEKALRGDTRAFQMVRDTAGQAPVQQVEVSALEQEQARFGELLDQLYGTGE